MGMIDKDRPELGELPTWDMTEMYPSRDSKELKRDLVQARWDARKFERKYKGKLAGLTPAGLASCIGEYEAIQDRMWKPGVYGYLTYTLAIDDPKVLKFKQDLDETMNKVSRPLVFFDLELGRMDDAIMNPKLADPAMAHYQPWVRDLRASRKHLLSDELELYQHDLSPVDQAWVRLFDETTAAMRFRINGKNLPVAQAWDLLSDPDADKRRAAGLAVAKGYAKAIKTFALITNTQALDKQIDDKRRGYPRPVSAANLDNLVEDEVVDALHRSVKDSYPRISHRYYALKAKWLGKEKLEFWDRGAPLPEADTRLIPWAESKDIVLSAFNSFSPHLGRIVEQFYDKGWIDAPTRPGKDPGAYCMSAVKETHPYVFLNYMGKPNDVLTEAHELGHGAHFVLSKQQGTLLGEAGTAFCETASVFAEMVTFRHLLNKQTDPMQRKAIMVEKLDGMINTVVRQIAFHDFETRVHTERRKGELEPDTLGNIWLESQKEALGPTFNLRANYKPIWAAIPHFIHSPFYVYSYAFADCLVNSLYDVYQKQPEGFEDKYIAMLASGGRHRHKELLAPFGLDASDPKFWQRGLNVVASLIDELEELDRQHPTTPLKNARSEKPKGP